MWWCTGESVFGGIGGGAAGAGVVVAGAAGEVLVFVGVVGEARSRRRRDCGNGGSNDPFFSDADGDGDCDDDCDTDDDCGTCATVVTPLWTLPCFFKSWALLNAFAHPGFLHLYGL